MSKTVNVNFKLDADVKKNMEQACSELGLSMSAAFTVFAKKVGREKRIPFEVSVDPFYSDSNIRYLENIVRDIKEGKAHFAEHDLIEGTNEAAMGRESVEVIDMCKAIEEMMNESEERGECRMLVKQVRKGRITIEQAAENANMSVEQFKNVMDDMPLQVV